MKYTYFNHASAAFPLAPGVTEAVAKAMNEPPRVSGRDTSGVDFLRQCRMKLAQVLHVSASQIVLTPGATYGLNMALLGLGLKPGDLVVASVMEHNSVLRPLAHLAEQSQIRVKHIPLNHNAGLDEDFFNQMLSEKPHLIVLTHASNVTGRVNPVRSLFAKAKNAGAVTLLDASQTMGRIPVIPEELHADIVVFPGHKGLRAPMGTGVLYVNPQIEINPVFTGGTGVKSDLRLQPEEMPMRLEAGTPNVPAFAGMEAALDYYREHAAAITEKEKAITERLFTGLSEIPGITIFDRELSGRLPVISFTIASMDAEAAGFALRESFGIECRAGLHCAPLMHEAFASEGTVRLSPAYDTSVEDVDYVLAAVREISKEFM